MIGTVPNRGIALLVARQETATSVPARQEIPTSEQASEAQPVDEQRDAIDPEVVDTPIPEVQTGSAADLPEQTRNETEQAPSRRAGDGAGDTGQDQNRPRQNRLGQEEGDRTQESDRNGDRAPLELDDSSTGSPPRGLDRRLPDPVLSELAEHGRWGSALQSVGQAGTVERAAFIADNLSTGMTEGAIEGGAAGVAFGLIGQGGRLALRRLPIPVVGPIIGGMFGVYGLGTQLVDVFSADGQILDALGAIGQGASDYEVAANTIAGLLPIIDLAANVADVAALVAGVLALACWAGAAPSFGGTVPSAAGCTAFASAAALASLGLGLTKTALQPLVMLFRSLHSHQSSADPRQVQASGAELAQSARAVGGTLALATGYLTSKAVPNGTRPRGSQPRATDPVEGSVPRPTQGPRIEYRPRPADPTRPAAGGSEAGRPPSATAPPRRRATPQRPDNSNNPSNPEGRASYTLPTGERVVRYPNGRTDIHYPNGTRTTNQANGHSHSRRADGTQITRTVDGQVTTSHPDGRTTVLHPDGTRVTTNRNGLTQTTRADGTSEAQLPNGSTRTTHADGSARVDRPDGSYEIHNPDGSVRVDRPDGSFRTERPDGSVATEYPSGDRIIAHPDGRRVTERTGRHARISVDADGSGTVRRDPQGRYTMTEYPDGRRVWDYGDGRVRIEGPHHPATESAPHGERMSVEDNARRRPMYDADGQRITQVSEITPTGARENWMQSTTPAPRYTLGRAGRGTGLVHDLHEGLSDEEPPGSSTYSSDYDPHSTVASPDRSDAQLEVERVNPNYERPPGTVEQLHAYRSEALRAQAEAEAAQADLSFSARDRSTYETRESQLAEATAVAETAHQASTQQGVRVSATRSENERQQRDESQVQEAASHASSSNGAVWALQGMLAGWIGTAGFLETIFGGIASVWDGARPAQQKCARGRADGVRLRSQLSTIDGVLEHESERSPLAMGRLEADHAELDTESTRTDETNEAISTASDDAATLSADNADGLEAATEYGSAARADATNAAEAADQNAECADTLDSDLRGWAERHAQQRSDAIDATVSSLEARGYEVANVSGR